MADKGSNLQQLANQIGNELTNVAQKCTYTYDFLSMN